MACFYCTPPPNAIGFLRREQDYVLNNKLKDFSKYFKVIAYKIITNNKFKQVPNKLTFLSNQLTVELKEITVDSKNVILSNKDKIN